MKVFYFICILSIFQIFNPLELGGIKFAISEQMANDLLFHFYPSINKRISRIPLGNMNIDGVDVKDIVFSIKNFNLNKLKLKFTEKGINITISGLKALITGVADVDKWYYSNDRDERCFNRYS